VAGNSKTAKISLDRPGYSAENYFTGPTGIITSLKRQTKLAIG
jgi:hypothetical protein